MKIILLQVCNEFGPIHLDTIGRRLSGKEVLFLYRKGGYRLLINNSSGSPAQNAVPLLNLIESMKK